MHTLQIGKYTLGSRLIVGSGKYDSFETTKAATLASGSQLITVAVRRLNITNPNEPNLRDTFAGTNVRFLPNSAGCTTAEEAITLFRLTREATGIDLIKLEVIGDTQKNPLSRRIRDDQSMRSSRQRRIYHYGVHQ